MEKRVLLVDPDPAFAERAVLAFAEAGVALEAVTGEEAALDRTRSLQPELVVLSERPDGNVFSICSRLRRTGPKGVTLAILAADPASGAIEAHRSSPTAADLYLPLPSEPDDLLAALGPRLGLDIAAIDDDEILALDEEEVDLAPDDVALAAHAEALQVQLAEDRRALEELERTVVALQGALQEERDRAAALEAKLADAEARAKSLSEVLDDSLAEREESDRAWTARLVEAEAAVAAVREEADGASRDAAGARGETEAARRETQEARSEAEAARTEAEAAKIEAIEARAEAEAANAELDELRAELAAARAGADEAANAELDELRALVAARAGADEAANAELERLQAELAAALARAEEATAALAAVPSTDAGVAFTTDHGAGPSIDAEALARELAEVRADRERMQDELAAELAHLAHDLAVRDGELSMARRRNAQLENVVRTLEAERGRPSRAGNGPPVAGDPAGELERLRAELEDLRGENVFLGTEVDRYAARLRELQRGNPR